MSAASRLSWRLRERFEKWLWQGSVDGKRIRHWLAPHLPWYLSDVEGHYWRKRMKDPDFWDKLEPANVSTKQPRHWSEMVVVNGTAYYKNVSGHPLMVQGYIDGMGLRTSANGTATVLER